jgi:hypothetical protein
MADSRLLSSSKLRQLEAIRQLIVFIIKRHRVDSLLPQVELPALPQHSLIHLH